MFYTIILCYLFHFCQILFLYIEWKIVVHRVLFLFGNVWRINTKLCYRLYVYVWLNKNIIKNWINRTNSNHISLILFYFFKVNWIKLNRTIFFLAVQISFNVKIIQTAPQTPLPTATSLITSHSMATTFFIFYLQSNYYYEYHFDYFQLPL